MSPLSNVELSANEISFQVNKSTNLTFNKLTINYDDEILGYIQLFSLLLK